MGNITTPVYIDKGKIISCGTYASGTLLTLNGVSYEGGNASIYAPRYSGTAGQILVSNGNVDDPSWEDKPHLYLHSIYLEADRSTIIYFSFINNVSSSYMNNFSGVIANLDKRVLATGIFMSSSGRCWITAVKKDTQLDSLNVVGFLNSDSNVKSSISISSASYIQDDVKQIL